MTAMHIERFVLPAEEDHRRVPLTTAFLKSCGDWKAVSFCRVKHTWIQTLSFPFLQDHTNFASHLLLLKSPDGSTTTAIYPVSTLACNNNLMVDTQSSPPVVQFNTRRNIPGEDCEVYVVIGQAKGRGEERSLVKRVVDEARKLVGGKPKSEVNGTFWDGLGVCTWESSLKGEIRPTKEILLELVPTLPIENFLIDDGWQDIRERSSKKMLHSFAAWDKMGGTLEDTVAGLKGKGVQAVGVWLTLQGYWFGIDPEGPLCKKYDCRPHPTAAYDKGRGGVVVPLPADGHSPDQWVPSPEKAADFWLDYFTEIKKWGVDFVKVDNQADADQITGPTAAHAQQAMWSGMLAALQTTWGSTDRIIMCMAHNDRTFNGPGALDVERPAGNLYFRNSDDYNLEDNENRHPDFIAWNAYGSVLTNHLSLVPDFDMFSSNPPEFLPTYHALLRCLSPGPMLVAETPGVKTDYSLIEKMTGNNRSGQLKAIKSPTGAATLNGRLFLDDVDTAHDGSALLASVPFPDAYGAVIGAWNIHEHDSGALALDAITLSDVEDALDCDDEGLTGEYALWAVGHSERNGQKVELVKKGSDMKLPIELKEGECEAVVVAKVWRVNDQKLAVVGMLDKFACLAGVKVGVSGDELIIHHRYSAKISVLALGPRRPSPQISVDGQVIEQVAEPELVGGAWVLNLDTSEEGSKSAGTANKAEDELFEIRLKF